MGRDNTGGEAHKTLTLTEAEPDAELDSQASPTADTEVAPPLSAGNALEAGERIGRYVVLSLLGAGGMGAVYAAYDPELDRRIALKVLGADPSQAPVEAQARLLREAQALARLSHPNVLPVHDVGVVTDRVFIAMELVEGDTLAAWMAQPHRLAEILAVFRAAGLGLAAAHAAGIVHRDFKPHNVLVGVDGRVRVADFGLARPPDDEESTTSPDAASSATLTQPRFDTPLTRPGAVLGTPAYMAPEQHRAQPTDARADQFAFCVALHEALHGVRPFDGAGGAALADATTANLRPAARSGRRAPASGRRVPGWLSAAVWRGLSLDPDDRFPSMEALLAAIGRDPAARRRRVAMAAATILLLAGTAAAWRLSRTAPCGGGERHLAGVWDDATRAAAAAGLRATRAPYVDDTWRAVAPRLDAYAADWTAMDGDACRATRVHGDQSDAVLELRMQCLRGRLGALHELVRLLSNADGAVVEHAAEAAAALPPIADCADVDRLRLPIPLPDDPARRAAVEKVRSDLIAVRARAAAGHYADGLVLAGPAAAAARATAYEPVVAEALLALGDAQRETAHPADAEASLIAAGLAAEASRHDEVTAAAWTGLVHLDSIWLGRYDQARRWADLADAAVRRLGDPPLARANQLDAVSDLLQREGHNDQALSRRREALALYEQALPADDPTVAGAHISLSETLEGMGRYQESLAEADRAAALLERTLGPQHPRMAGPLDAGGVALWRLGRLAEAEARLRSALALSEHGLTPDHPQISVTLANLANVLSDEGRDDEARAALERALAIDEKMLGPRHVNIAHSLSALGSLARGRSDLPAARAYFERALAIREAALGPDAADDPEIAGIRDNLGNVAYDEGRYTDAITLQERALATEEKAFGRDHPKVALTLSHLSGDYISVGRLADAAAAGERALAIYERTLGPDHPDLVGPLDTLSEIYVAQGRAAEALPLSERAVALADQAGPRGSESAQVALVGLGIAYLGTGQPARAVAPLERAVALDPTDPDARALLARARREIR